MADSNMAYRRKLLHWTLLVFLILDKGESCSQGWISNLNSCYKLFFVGPVDKAFGEAICLHHKSALPSISNPEEKNFLATAFGSSGQKFWVGLHKIDDELLWNNRLSAVNLSWVDASSINGSSDCFVFDTLKVLPLNCSDDASVVCEQWLPPPTAGESACPEGSHEDLYSGKCFWYTHMPLSKPGSDVVCSLKHGSLIEMRGRGFPLDVAMFLTHEPISPRPNPLILWTSLEYKNKSLVFRDGTQFSDQSLEVSLSGDKVCVVLVVEKGKRYALRTKPCLQEARGICQLNVDIVDEDDSNPLFERPSNPSNSSVLNASCPAVGTWQEHNETGFCTLENSHQGPYLSWEDARKYCQSFGGDLASFRNQEEQRTVFINHDGPHSYWIGLYYDAHDNNYKWSDGTVLNYTKWDTGQPDHQDNRLRCGYLDNIKGNWRMNYCGSLSWFICKAPKQINPPTSLEPWTPEPLINCSRNPEFYFNGYCYRVSTGKFIWHRAQAICEEQLGNLVSVHNEREVHFLIRLMALSDVPLNNRVWIGLNTLGFGGAFRWTDGSPVDFVNWNTGEPDNRRNQEKCVNMNTLNAMWSDINCNAQLNLICKRRNDTTQDVSASPNTTAAPMTGFCKQDWKMFGDRCFRLVGQDKSDWKNWTEASMTCLYFGGYLASVRNAREQAFLYYLAQTAKEDTWIGLHNALYFGGFYWTDNSPLYYTNWASGEPSPKWAMEENCAVISYGETEFGRWKDTVCTKRLPYICQIPRDPAITKSGSLGERICRNSPGYVKQGSSCYRMFTVPGSWDEAENTCTRDQGHVVSLHDMDVTAFVNYLVAKSLSDNDTFWIGLQSINRNSLKWLNGYPMSFSRWGSNEPQISNESGDCFYTALSGFWQHGSCSQRKQIICQISQGSEPPQQPLVPTKGICTGDRRNQWTAVGNFCFLLSSLRMSWRDANLQCSSLGAHLVSFHSMHMLENVTLAVMKDPVFIGLTKNSEGGFMWSDGSPVDFVNWDQGEPRYSSDKCVEMARRTMKWRVTPCEILRKFICAKRKDYMVGYMEITKDEEKKISTQFPVGAVVAVVVIIVLLVVGAVITVIRLRPPKREWDAVLIPKDGSVTSFENQIYPDDGEVDIHNTGVSYAKK